MAVGWFLKVLMIKLLMYEIKLAPELTPKNLEVSEMGEPSEIYSGYLRCGNTIDSVWHNEIIEWE